jgi:TrmH family RNA methyltransferase
MDIAVLFGKESRGLTNKELELIDILLRIPASESYPTLNLSHAVGIILYELYKKLHSITIGRGEHPVLLADKEDRQILYQYIENLMKKIKVRNYRKNDSIQAFKNIFERAMMSNRELTLILGFFSRLSSLLEDVDLFEDENETKDE